MKVIEVKELDSVRGQGIGSQSTLSFSNHSISTKAVNQHICLVCLLCASTADTAVTREPVFPHNQAPSYYYLNLT